MTGGIDHLAIVRYQVESGNDGEGAVENEEMTRVSRAEAEGPVEGADCGEGGLGQLQPVDG